MGKNSPKFITIFLFCLFTSFSFSITNELFCMFHVLKNNHFQQKEIDPDDQIIQDLSLITEDCYQKILKITALYFSGVLLQSDRMYQEIILEITKHLFDACHAITLYLPKLLKNSKISKKEKIKRYLLITCFMATFISWCKQKNFYIANNENKSLREA